jgi:hypothetical protein
LRQGAFWWPVHMSASIARRTLLVCNPGCVLLAAALAAMG